MSVEDDPEFTERRKNVVSLDPAALAAFRDIHEGMGDVAKSNVLLADVLAVSMRKQFRYMRWWMAILTIGVVILIGFSIANRYSIAEAQDSAKAAVKAADTINDCVDPNGTCFKRQQSTSDAYIAVLTQRLDAAIANRQNDNRKTLAQELLCYTEKLCPPEYDRNHIPDLAGIYPPGTTTTTTTSPGTP